MKPPKEKPSLLDRVGGKGTKTVNPELATITHHKVSRKRQCLAVFPFFFQHSLHPDFHFHPTSH